MLYSVENYKAEIPVTYGIKYMMYSAEFTSTPFTLNDPIIFLPTTSLNDKPTPSYEWATNKLTLTCDFTNSYIYVEEVGIKTKQNLRSVTITPGDISGFVYQDETSKYNAVVQAYQPSVQGTALTTSIDAPDPFGNYAVWTVRCNGYMVVLENKLNVGQRNGKIAAYAPALIHGAAYPN